MTTEIYFMIAIALIALIPTFIHNSNWSPVNPEKKPYAWGFFCGYSNMIAGAVLALMFITCIATGATDGLEEIDYLTTFIGVITGALGYGIIKRKRVAFVICTILSFNPILWIINGVYIKRRWEEFEPEDKFIRIIPG